MLKITQIKIYRISAIVTALLLIILSLGWIKFLMTPTISVVMPVYNRQDLVGRAIDSILNQTYKNFEFIIVDDGSTDGTPAILQAYAHQDSRIKLLTNTENKGISYSRQRGLDAAKGKYVAIMDSDDWSVPSRLEKSLAFMRDYPDIDAVSGTVVDMRGDFMATYFNSEKVRQLYRVAHDSGFHEVELAFDNTFQNTTALFKRRFVQDHHIRYNMKMQSAEDYDFWIRIVLAGGRLASLQDILGYARRHETNSDAYYKEMKANSLALHKEMFSLFFTPTKDDLRFGYSQSKYCRILNKMINSARKQSVIPVAWIKQRYDVGCPQDIEKSFYIRHQLWSDFLAPVSEGHYKRYFSTDDTASIELTGNRLIVHWDDWDPESFIKEEDDDVYVWDENGSKYIDTDK